MLLTSSGNCFVPNTPYGDDRTMLGYHVAVDSEGNPDALTSYVLDEFYNLTTWRFVTITAPYAGAPDALAYDYYGNEQLYWVPMLFNGLTSYQQFIEGATIRMPDRNKLFRLLSQPRVTEAPIRKASL